MGGYLVLLQIDVHVLLIVLWSLSFPKQKIRGSELGVWIDRGLEKGMGKEGRKENAAWCKINFKKFKNVIFAFYFLLIYCYYISMLSNYFRLFIIIYKPVSSILESLLLSIYNNILCCQLISAFANLAFNKISS